MIKGNPSQELTERNTALISDYKSGVAIIDLIAKYRLSSTRIFRIIQRAKEKKAKLDRA